MSPQRQAHNRNTVKKLGLTFPLLEDSGNRLAGELGLVFSFPEDLKEVYNGFGIDLARVNGDDSWSLPMPARFVIDRESTIRSVDVDPDYTRRPEPAKILEDLRGL